MIDPEDRLRLVREYLRAAISSDLAIFDREDHDAAADIHQDAAALCWGQVDEEGRHAMRWGMAALQVLEQACLGGDVPAPPWLDRDSTPAEHRVAMANFFSRL